MKLPANFYRPLAIGAPLPLRELPVRPERMIHFFPPHVEKIRARIPEMAKQIDVLCGNLEDAIPIDAKEAARAGFIAVAQSTDFGGTALWTRVNALNSPWFLDERLTLHRFMRCLWRRTVFREGDLRHPPRALVKILPPLTRRFSTTLQ